jgi:threonine synthase
MIEFVYKCSTCGERYQRDAVRYLCPSCAKDYHAGIPLVGVLSVEFDYDTIKEQFDKRNPDWTLFSAVEEKYFPAFPVGETPFFKSDALGHELGFDDIWIKNDGLNPSGSLKDRASFLVVAEAKRIGEGTVVTASTGNAASALAAVCAAAGTRALILVPEKAPRAKLVQMLLHGACVIPVRGTYDDAFRLTLEYTNSKGGLNRNTAYHPLTIEGKKTVGLEIFRQNKWKAPDAIFVPVGDGVILTGVYKAFYDLKAAGLITRMPRLVCVQAESSAAIHHYIQTGTYHNAERPVTIADSISVSIPSNAHMARAAVIATGGFSVTVNDNEILQAQKVLARKAGVFAEPAAAAAVAGLKKSRDAGLLDPKGQVVALITGHGLKDIDAALKNIQMPVAVEPTLEGVESALKGAAPSRVSS